VIYAIRAVGTKYIKFGKANNPKTRLEEHQTGCPFKLELEAVADWPNKEEYGIHAFLTAIGAHCRGEWFTECDEALDIIGAMKQGLKGWRDQARKNAPRRLLRIVASG
jgi:hypothetical protein